MKRIPTRSAVKAFSLKSRSSQQQYHYHTDPNFQCVISQCKGLFPPAFSSAEKTPGNEVASFAGGPKYFENMADSISEFHFYVSHDQRWIILYYPLFSKHYVLPAK